MSSASPRPQKRTAQTCVTCRTRKVRCDGRKGLCTSCERLGLPCSWDDTFALEGILVPNSAILAQNQQQQQQQQQHPQLQQQPLPLISDSRVPEGNSNAPSLSAAPLLIPRRRARQACQNCHAKKARCSGSMPICDRCRVQGLDCVYRPGKRALVLPSPTSLAGGGGQQQQQSSQEPPEPQDVTMQDDSTASLTHSNAASPNSLASPPPRDLPMGALNTACDPPLWLISQAFRHYFSHVHHIPVFSFLHRASLMDTYSSGTLDRSLILALIGITSLLTDLKSGTPESELENRKAYFAPEYGRRCIEEAANICLAHAEDISIARLEALVIVVKHRLLSSRFQGAFLLFSLASRMATALRLHCENPTLCFLAQETRRRLMWSIYIIDSTISNGKVDFSLWPNPERQIRINLPCNERRFELDISGVTEPLIPPAPPLPSAGQDSEGGNGTDDPGRDTIGLLALHTRMYHMRSKILQRTMQVIASGPSQAELDALPGVVAGLVAELDAFESRLLPSFRFSAASLKLRSYSPRLGIFFMTHVLWRQCHLDLYRLFLPGLKEALPLNILKSCFDKDWVVTTRGKCYEHARSMAEMFTMLLSPEMSVPVTDIDLAGCAHQCVKVLYHGMQTWGQNIGFTRDAVEKLASGCLRAATEPTKGTEAGRALLADIQQIKTEGGIHLVMTTGVVNPGMGQMGGFQGFGGGGDSGAAASASSPATVTQASVSGAQMPVTTTALTPLMASMPTGFSPIAAGLGAQSRQQQQQETRQVEPPAASIAPSHSSVRTSGSNAFEESLDDLANLGADFFSDDNWMSAFSGGGNMMSSNDWLNSMSTIQLSEHQPPPPSGSS